MRRVPDLDVKDPAWRETVLQAIARNSVRGVPRPTGLPADGYLKIRFQRGRWRVSYEVARRQSITLGTASESAREQVRQQWLASHPVTLECGRRVFVFFDHGNPDLARPVPVEVVARIRMAAT